MTRRALLRSALVATIGIGLLLIFLPREYRAAVVTYQLTADPRMIVLHAKLGPGDIVVGSEVNEDSERIVVIVKARDISAVNAGEGDSHFVTVSLRDPVGERTVIDGTDLPGLAGHVVPRVP